VELSRRQRKAVFETLVRNGLDPSEGVELSDENWPIQIRHHPSQSRFQIDMASKRGTSGYLGSGFLGGGVPFGEFSICNWDQLMGDVAEWAKEVRYELDTPDPWQELKNTSQVLAQLDDELEDNTPFTDAEQEQISERLAAIEQHIATTVLNR
jgi:hypothetical protein